MPKVDNKSAGTFNDLLYVFGNFKLVEDRNIPYLPRGTETTL